jgi:hypothetical protein
LKPLNGQPNVTPAQRGVFYELIEEEKGQITRHSRFKDV